MSDDSKKQLSPEQEELVREYVRSKLKEIVRKKEGGGGYVLYSPNKGKKNPPKAVGEFPSKLMAKRAELQRYPPKDTGRLQRVRKQIDKLQKDPKKRAEKERTWARGKKSGTHGAPRKESPKKNESLVTTIRAIVTEALFREEENAVSQWDDRVSKLSKAAVETDKKLQRLQKDIEKKTVSSLERSVDIVAKTMKKIKVKVSGGDVKRDPQRMKSYVELSLNVDGTEVAPVYVFVENGKLRYEVSGTARGAFTKLKPERAKSLRAELVALQEDVLDGQAEITKAIQARDKYLDALQTKIDDHVAGLSALEISVLKNVLVNKYRGK